MYGVGREYSKKNLLYLERVADEAVDLEVQVMNGALSLLKKKRKIFVRHVVIPLGSN